MATQRDINKIRYTPATARELADELAADPQKVATAQAYIGKLQSETERELVMRIYYDLQHLKIGNGFWHRLQTAAMIRQRNAHFRADVLTAVTEEREQAQRDMKKKRTVIDKLLEHKQELLDLSELGKSSKEISKYMHRAHRSQFPQHGSPHFKTVQLALRQIRQ
jgi:hypothetical protein